MCDLVHTSAIFLELSPGDGNCDTIQMTEINRHCYILLSAVNKTNLASLSTDVLARLSAQVQTNSKKRSRLRRTFFPKALRTSHAMVSVSIYSSWNNCPKTSMTSSMKALQASWLSELWTPQHIQADHAFVNDEFESFLKTLHIELRSVPTRRHCKNAI